MTEEIPLGEDWKLTIDFGTKSNLVRILTPKNTLADEMEFSKGFWRRKRLKKDFRSFIEKIFNDFGGDFDTPEIDDEEFRDLRMEVSSRWDQTEFSENNEVELPFEEEDQSEEIKHAGEEVLKSPKLIHLVHDAIHKEQGIVGETANGMLSFFVMLSTLSEEPINLRVSGRGSTGKSTMVVSVTKLFPGEMKLVMTSPTKRSLYYDEELVKEIDEKNRFLDARGLIMVILEEENCQAFLDEMKELLGHDKMKSDIPFAVGGGGGSPETHHLWVYGWPAYTGVTTKPVEEETQSSRTMLITPNRGSEKYSAANRRDAFEDSFPWLKHGNWRTRIIREAISNLDRYKVWNPFSLFVEDEFPSHKKARMMRDWDRLSSLMKTVTLLFQEQRRKVKIRDETHLVTAPIDVEIALEVGKNAMVEAIQGLDKDVREFYIHLRSGGIDKLKGYKELIAEYNDRFDESINRSTLRERYVNKLEDRGLIEVDSSGRANTFYISGKNLEKMEDLRNKLGDMSNKEMEEKVKSSLMEYLEGNSELKDKSVANGLYREYEMELSNPGVDEETLSHTKVDNEYKEKLLGVVEDSFSLSRSQSSVLKKPLESGDYWLKEEEPPKPESSINSKSYEEIKEEEDELPEGLELSGEDEGEGDPSESKDDVEDYEMDEEELEKEITETYNLGDYYNKGELKNVAVEQVEADPERIEFRIDKMTEKGDLVF